MRVLFIEKINLDYPTRTKGVVEKCEFCPERLAEGKMPSCVEVSQGRLRLAIWAILNPKCASCSERFSIRRSPYLGTKPCVYYLV
jgi:Fe-S-cluster-containing dehydrogenase component